MVEDEAFGCTPLNMSVDEHVQDRQFS
eukprot:COSAG02_NODE_60827_length_270_cov_0.608187_1_plen_26_part_01